MVAHYSFSKMRQQLSILFLVAFSSSLFFAGASQAVQDAENQLESDFCSYLCLHICKWD